jgi:hypothetical protein
MDKFAIKPDNERRDILQEAANRPSSNGSIIVGGGANSPLEGTSIELVPGEITLLQ